MRPRTGHPQAPGALASIQPGSRSSRRRVPRVRCSRLDPPGRPMTRAARAPTGEGVEGGGLVLVGVPIGGVADHQAGLAHGAIAHQHALDPQLRAAAAGRAVSPQGGSVIQELLGRHGNGNGNGNGTDGGTAGSAGLSVGRGAAGPLPCS